MINKIISIDSHRLTEFTMPRKWRYQSHVVIVIRSLIDHQKERNLISHDDEKLDLH